MPERERPTATAAAHTSKARKRKVAPEPVADARAKARRVLEQRLATAHDRIVAEVAAAESAEELDAVVASLTAALDTLPVHTDGHPLARRVGPCWTLEGAAVRLRGRDGGPLNPETLRVRATKHTLVGVQAADDRRWYLPAWQFDTDRGQLQVLDDVVALWQLLPHDTASAWTHAAWMASPLRSLDGLSPLAWVTEHGLDDTVVDAARRVSVRLSA